MITFLYGLFLGALLVAVGIVSALNLRTTDTSQEDE